MAPPLDGSTPTEIPGELEFSDETETPEEIGFAEPEPSEGTEEPEAPEGVEPPAAGESAAHFRFFSPTSLWNAELAPDEPLDPTSAATVAPFDGEVAAEQQARRGPSINTNRWSIPLYTVPGDQPTVRVTQTGGTSPALQAAWSSVPLPADAWAAIGTDKHLVVWQPSADRLWEFWRLEGGPGAWRAAWGGAMEHVSSSSGVYGPSSWLGSTTGWGGSATSLSLAGGLITLEDLERGQIDHALAIGIPNVRAGACARPAMRSDGRSTNPLSLPEGAHLRLDPDLDLASLHLPRFTMMLAESRSEVRHLRQVEGRRHRLLRTGPDAHGREPLRRAARLLWRQVAPRTARSVPLAAPPATGDGSARELLSC